MTQHDQNQISQNFTENDLREREGDILKEISESTGFVPTKLLGRSSWWGSSHIGAFHYTGTYEGKNAVLKVQGVKPTTSEIYMLESFAKENRSDVLRPPFLYTSLPWSDEKGYEALIMEDVKGNKVVSTPATSLEINTFFSLYEDYRSHCLNNPWIDKPTQTISEGLESSFKKWREASLRIFPHHPHRLDSDATLIEQSLTLLKEKYIGVDMEFQHGHFSVDDLYKVGDKVVLLSNLYWSWRPPLYDAVFAYHWHLYTMGNMVDNISPKHIEEQRQLWLSTLYNLPHVAVTTKLLKLALLERAVAGLVIDSLTVDPNRPVSEYLVSRTREQVIQMLDSGI